MNPLCLPKMDLLAFLYTKADPPALPELQQSVILNLFPAVCLWNFHLGIRWLLFFRTAISFTFHTRHLSDCMLVTWMLYRLCYSVFDF